jgi:hypothetical protein
VVITKRIFQTMLKFHFQTGKIIRVLGCALAFCIMFFVQRSHAETPEQFARKFSSFAFCYHAEVQDPEVFLSTKSGDCDDYATLAADRLGKSGYDTHLFAVRMNGETHVVCYVPAVKGYLDYNNRAASNPLVYCDGSLQCIAENVARSFKRKWGSAYEFSYHQKMKWLVNDIFFNRGSPTLLATVK